NRNPSLEIHQIKQLDDLIMTGLQTARPSPVAKMGGDNTVKVKKGRQNRMNDGILIIGLVLCVCVENDTHFFGRIRNKERVHRLLLVLKEGFVLFHCSSHAGDEIALEEEEHQHDWHNSNQDGCSKLVILR